MEAFAKNCARLVEEGGKALAAYLKPREEGQIKGEMPEEVADVVKTLGQVVEYWLRDPQRAFELQAGLAKDYLDLWAAASQAPGRRGRAAGRRARPEGSPLHRSGMDHEPVLRFPQAGLSADHPMGRSPGQGRDGPRLPHQAEGRVLRAPDRQRDLAVEFRADQSGAAARDAVHRTPTTSCAACTCWREDIEAGGGDLQIRQSDTAMFEVGRNLAITPGKVIFQNELMQLHPVCADDAQGAQASAADRAAVDQQVLRARPRRRRNPSSSGASTRA